MSPGRGLLTAGRVIATAGRRVVVADADGERVCVLAGHRVVVGDQVDWIEVPGEGGKVVGVRPRTTSLVRTDLRAREQVVAANLEGIAIVAATVEPPFRPGLVDRYVVAANVGGLKTLVVLNKIDQGLPAEVAAHCQAWVDAGIEVIQTSAATGIGLEALGAHVAAAAGPWALVGHSGVGKTSLVAALLPGSDAGPIGPLSEHWGTGQHTTTGSRIFGLPGGGEIVDSPGIRTFAPGRLAAVDVRQHFPGLAGLGCRYRDCLHRADEEGCVADAEIPPTRLESYRRLVLEMLELDERRRPGGRRRSRTKR